MTAPSHTTLACTCLIAAGTASAGASPASAQAPAAPAPTSQSSAAATPPAADAQAAPAKQDFLVVYFDEGSAAVRSADLPVLDQASRTYREGNPIVMVLSGSADSVGAPIANLALSQRRANAVLQALVARGIPAARFQVLAKGETEPAVPAQAGTPEPRDRRVEIAWR